VHGFGAGPALTRHVFHHRRLTASRMRPGPAAVAQHRRRAGRGDAPGCRGHTAHRTARCPTPRENHCAMRDLGNGVAVMSAVSTSTAVPVAAMAARGSRNTVPAHSIFDPTATATDSATPSQHTPVM
jgi:hypothetical protein